MEIKWKDLDMKWKLGLRKGCLGIKLQWSKQMRWDFGVITSA